MARLIINIRKEAEKQRLAGNDPHRNTPENDDVSHAIVVRRETDEIEVYATGYEPEPSEYYELHSH